jgi:hypothetical protein
MSVPQRLHTHDENSDIVRWNTKQGSEQRKESEAGYLAGGTIQKKSATQGLDSSRRKALGNITNKGIGADTVAQQWKGSAASAPDNARGKKNTMTEPHPQMLATSKGSEVCPVPELEHTARSWQEIEADRQLHQDADQLLRLSVLTARGREKLSTFKSSWVSQARH